MGGAFLEWALEAFSGYAAVDALSAGPYCGLAAVDHRQDTRVLYEVLEHDPHHRAIEAFLGRCKAALEARDLALKGSTTDGSALSPDPIRQVCGAVPHQLCTFHVLKDLPQGVLKAVAKARERLAPAKPQLTRGRPSSKDKAARRLARTSKALRQKISDLCEQRFVCVPRRLRPSERKRFVCIPRGLPQVRKRREILDPMYALFARRCRTPTALGKWKKLRQWVRRFTWSGETVKKVFSPHLAHALTFLDEQGIAGDLQRGRARQSASSHEAKECVPGSQQGLCRGSYGPGHAPRISRRRPRPHHAGVTAGA
jgi:hypothetical protein